MPENNKITTEFDELSRLIDEMNSGHNPECSDKEIAELLEVAVLLHSAELAVQPPQHLVNQTVDRAMAGLQAGRPKRLNSWFYSGALGTAAAVMLIFGLSLLPSWSHQLPLVLPPAVNSDLQNTATDTAKQPATASKSTPAAEQGKSADTEPQYNAAAEPQLPGQMPAIAKAVTPPVEQPSLGVTVKRAPDMAEQAPIMREARSFTKATTPAFPAAPKNLPKGVTILSIPGRTPDSIQSDTVSGELRQVFNKGTSEEIIITQRVHLESIPSKSVATAMSGAEEAPGALNRVTVTIYGQDITVEGLQSRQELMKIAKSLTQ